MFIYPHIMKAPMVMGFLSSWTFGWIVLPILIFLARICDVSLGTIRVIFISKGFKGWAAFLAFFEICIWLLAIRQIMLNLTNPLAFVAYALGFAAGNYVGVYIESKMSIGKVMIRIITKGKNKKLLEKLQKSEHTITCTDSKGSDGKVKVLFVVCERHKVKDLLDITKECDAQAYYSVADVRYASQDNQQQHQWNKQGFLTQLWNKKK